MSQTIEFKAQNLLKSIFGYEQFREQQLEIIQHIAEGQDCVVLMPTGGGKSICFQIPALLTEGLTIVISPLISLMKDQVEALRSNGIEAAFLNTTVSVEEERETNQKIKEQKLKLLYVAPERFIHQNFVAFFESMNVSLIAIDEAHCVSQWGHDFRPEYNRLSIIKKTHPNIPVVALTATADNAVRKDIQKSLALTNDRIFIGSFDRPNLSLTVLPGQNKKQYILEFVEGRKEDTGIVYCFSRKETEDLAAYLQSNGIRAACYHAGMNHKDRSKVQEEFIYDKLKVICATIAFGMGIDKPNVRYVIHHNLPKNLESFYQEIGRAGRDGLQSDTLLFYSYRDVMRQMRFIDEIEQVEYKDMQEAKLKRMQEYAEANACRRKILLSYFAEYNKENCGNCDVCKNPPNYFNATIIAQKALSVVARTKQSASMTNVIQVLLGRMTQDIVTNEWNYIKTFGQGKELNQFSWQIYIMQLIQHGYLTVDYSKRSVLQLTPLSEGVLFEKEQVQLVSIESIQEKRKIAKETPVKRTKTQTRNDELTKLLKSLRMKLAKGKPAYTVFNDATLRELVKEKPTSEFELLEIEGVGAHKAKLFGSAITECISNFMVKVSSQGGQVKGSTYQFTWQLMQQGKSVEDIAEIREMSSATVLSHVTYLVEQNYKIDLDQYISDKEKDKLNDAVNELGKTKALKPYYEFCNEKIQYNKIKLFLAHIKNN